MFDGNVCYNINLKLRKLDWFDDEVSKKAKHMSKIVILKNMFTKQELDVNSFEFQNHKWHY
jgi:hypothetical protein